MTAFLCWFAPCSSKLFTITGLLFKTKHLWQVEGTVYILLSPASFSTPSFRFLTSLACSFVFLLYVQVHSNLQALMYILNRLSPLVWIHLYWNTFSCNRSPRPGYNRRALTAQLDTFAGFTYYCLFLPQYFQHYLAIYLFAYIVLAKFAYICWAIWLSW